MPRKVRQIPLEFIRRHFKRPLFCPRTATDNTKTLKAPSKTSPLYRPDNLFLPKMNYNKNASCVSWKVKENPLIFGLF